MVSGREVIRAPCAMDSNIVIPRASQRFRWAGACPECESAARDSTYRSPHSNTPTVGSETSEWRRRPTEQRHQLGLDIPIHRLQVGCRESVRGVADECRKVRCSSPRRSAGQW